MNIKQNSRAKWIVMTLLGCGLALIALVGQVVSAQSTTEALKPPFKFAERPAAPQVQALPPGSTVLMTESFGATFTATTDLQGSTPLWRVTTNTGDKAGYYWDKTGASAPIAFSNSAWSAARRYTATLSLTPGVSTYPAGQDSWLIYGPINLSKFIYGHLSFSYYLDSQAGDTLLWGYSTDGQTFYGNSQSGPVSGPAGTWITDTITFRTNPSFQTVYLAFAFNSHTTPQGKGAFVRNVRLTGEPRRIAYMPIVMTDYAQGMFGPYEYDSGTADIDHWGGPFYNTGNKKYGQCVTGQCAIHPTDPHGNPGNSLRLYTNALYSFVASSPNDIAPANYDLYVDMSPWVYYARDRSCPFGCPSPDLGDWYGIIFNASNSTFGTNPSQFAYNKTYYRLYFYNVDATKPIALRLDRCDGSSNSADNSCVKLANKSLPSDFLGNASGFDNVHIQRLASGPIKVWLNGTLLISVTDATYTGSGHGKYGVFIFSWTLNDTSSPPDGTEMQIDFDNIRLLPRLGE